MLITVTFLNSQRIVIICRKDTKMRDMDMKSHMIIRIINQVNMVLTMALILIMATEVDVGEEIGSVIHHLLLLAMEVDSFLVVDEVEVVGAVEDNHLL